MLRIEKFVLLGVLMMTQLTVFAQNNTTSPYTRFGFGDLADRSFGAGRAMGGVGIGLRSPKQINPMNPASYTSVDSLTFIFDVGVSLQVSKYQDTSNQYREVNGNLEYIALQFPITRWLAMSAGLLPYSFVGYQFGEVDEIGDEYYQNTYSGEGGLNELYAGLSIEIWKKRLAIGANFGFLFGNVDHIQSLTFSSSTAYTNERTQRIKVQDMRMNFGMQYTHPLSARESLTFGAIYSPKNRLNTKTYDIFEQQNSSGTTLESTTDTISGATYDLPHTFGVGASYTKYNKLTVAADFQYELWDDALYRGELGNYQDRKRVAVGAEYLPDLRGKNYFKQVRYRVGFHYNNSYVKVNRNEENAYKGYGYNEYGVSVGLGLPVMDYRSLLNVAFEFVKVKPEHASLIDEQYFRITLNYTFNERWFYKFKLE